MSQYATIADLEVYGLPSAVVASLGVPALNKFLQRASGLVDERISSQLSLPIAPDALGGYPSGLVIATCHIAAYLILRFIGFNPENGDETVRDDYRDALKWASEVGSNKIQLFDVDDATDGFDEGEPIVMSDESRGW